MNDVTQILQAIEQGDGNAAHQLLPLVYDELRKLAAAKLAQEQPGQTLQATALVHEAYLKLVAGERRGVSPTCSNAGADDKSRPAGGIYWHGRGHFFAAAAEAMRRILINRARDKGRIKRGGGLARVDFDGLSVADQASDDHLLALDEALERLESHNKPCAELVKLRFFAGLSMEEAAAALGIAPRTAHRYWAFARAWLYDDLRRD